MLKIDAKKLGIKKLVEVKETGKNVQRAMLIQRDMVKAQFDSRELKDKDEETITFEDIDADFNTGFGLIDSINDFVAKALKLNDEQIEVLVEDTEQADVMEIAAALTEGLLKVGANADEKAAPKAVADTSLTD